MTAPSSDEAKALDGSYTGYQPKPAVEIVIVCMKPLDKKTFVDQALDNGKGITWLDKCRIPFADDNDKPKDCTMPDINSNGGISFNHLGTAARLEYEANLDGRFPANLIVSDDILNNKTSYQANNGKIISIDNDFDSRYFSLDSWDKDAQNKYPFIVVPKASKSEKNKGCESLSEKKKWNVNGGGTGISDREKIMSRNFHPTVKPLKLMRYLITLATRENDIVLDPFNGSGTTCVASLQLKRQYIGIDFTPEYVEIAEKRLSAELDVIQQRLF